MSGRTAVTAAGSAWRGSRRRTLRIWNVAAIMLSALALPALSACSDFHMAASSLDIGPNPAVPGDMVVASFLLSLVPTTNHTIVFIIDDAEHLRIESNAPPAIPVIIEVGSAADLIDMYGPGDHEAYVRVFANDDSARTEAVVFRLNAAAPQGGP
ncbi:MAG: hypothetical protein KFH98_15565 [Gemmatimonadetes bacterium]|nr:hypothetical protein [Gemmatimonadota bacterium]